MFGRSFRAETRSRAKEEIKRVANAIDKVRKWEKKWITISDTSMKVYKWVPATNQEKKKKMPLSKVPVPLADTRTEKNSEPVSSLPKHMLGYMNDETSQDSIASDKSDSLNEENSRDSNNFTPMSSLSVPNNDDSNNGLNLTDGLHDESSRFSTISDKNDEDSNPPPAKRRRSDDESFDESSNTH